MTVKKHTPSGAQSSTSARTKRPAKPKLDSAPELEALAYHLAEVLRISRTHPDIPPQLYNMIGEAWTEFQNGTPNSADVDETSEVIRLQLVGGIAQRKAAQKGGAK